MHEQTAQPGRPISPSAALTDAALHRRALERIAPPSILVDGTHRVVHLSENAGRFVQPSGGPLSGDVVALVRPEFRFELRSALHRAFEQRRSTLSLPILVRFNGAPHRVHLQVKPAVGDDEAEPRNALVMFIEGEAIEETLVSYDQEQASDETVRRLTHELELTQARLRTVREESESANEELHATNEELQSINEEYRSTSEELETSKEELQSINEELQTVNSELKLKLETISRAHSDLQNLIAATDFGTLFLDSSQRIRWFTDRITELFSITQADEGRLITDFSHQLEYDDLIKDVRAVLADLAPIRREIRSGRGRWYDVRMRPYRTMDNKIEGVVITFMDVTERLQVDEALRESERQLRQQKRLVELSRDPIFVWDFDGGIVEWNRGSEELYGYKREEALGKSKEQFLGPGVPGSSFMELRTKLLQEGSWTGELRHRTKDGRLLTVESRIQLEILDGRRLVLESTRDVTDRKSWEERQRLLLRELTHRVKNSLAVVQAIAHQTLCTSKSGDDFVERFEGRLAALASAHNLLVQSEWKGADLRALACGQLEPYATEQLHFEGESVLLPADLATSFGLVFHELATNAAKYGYLSQPRGTVHVTWTVNLRDGHGVLTVCWREKGGPSVKPPASTGFGTSLIDRGIANAKVTREFGRNGFACTIELTLPETAEIGTIDKA